MVDRMHPAETLGSEASTVRAEGADSSDLEGLGFHGVKLCKVRGSRREEREGRAVLHQAADKGLVDG